MKTTLIVAALSISAVTALAQESRSNPRADVLYMGQFYRSAQVGAARDGMASIRAGGKSATVPVSALPPILKQRALALQAEREQSAARLAKPSPTPDGQIHATVRVFQSTPAGLLASRGDGQVILIRDYPGAANVADGERITFKGVEDGLFEYTTAMGTASRVRAYKVAGQ